MSTDTTTSKGDPRESLNVASRVILKSSSNRAHFEFMRAVWRRVVQGSIPLYTGHTSHYLVWHGRTPAAHSNDESRDPKGIASRIVL